jgi:hypothetical protein
MHSFQSVPSAQYLNLIRLEAVAGVISLLSAPAVGYEGRHLAMLNKLSRPDREETAYGGHFFIYIFYPAHAPKTSLSAFYLLNGLLSRRCIFQFTSRNTG